MIIELYIVLYTAQLRDKAEEYRSVGHINACVDTGIVQKKILVLLQ